MTRQVFPRPVWSQTCIHPDRETDFKAVWWGKNNVSFKCLIFSYLLLKQMSSTHARMVKGCRKRVIKVILVRWFIFVNATSDRQANSHVIKVNWKAAGKGDLKKRTASGWVWTELAWTTGICFKEALGFPPFVKSWKGQNYQIWIYNCSGTLQLLGASGATCGGPSNLDIPPGSAHFPMQPRIKRRLMLMGQDPGSCQSWETKRKCRREEGGKERRKEKGKKEEDRGEKGRRRKQGSPYSANQITADTGLWTWVLQNEKQK